jgi:NYN domain
MAGARRSGHLFAGIGGMGGLTKRKMRNCVSDLPHLGGRSQGQENRDVWSISNFSCDLEEAWPNNMAVVGAHERRECRHGWFGKQSAHCQIYSWEGTLLTAFVRAVSNDTPRQTAEFVEASGRRRVKGNMDIELAVDAMEFAENIGQLVPFSGDGDFRFLVEAAQRRGVRVTQYCIRPVRSRRRFNLNPLRADSHLKSEHPLKGLPRRAFFLLRPLQSRSAPPFAGFFLGLFPCLPSLHHVGLTAVGLRHTAEAFGNFGVWDGPRNAFSFKRLFPEKLNLISFTIVRASRRSPS